MQLLERKKRERKARPYLSANWCLVKEEGAFYLTKPHKYLEKWISVRSIFVVLYRVSTFIVID